MRQKKGFLQGGRGPAEAMQTKGMNSSGGRGHTVHDRLGRNLDIYYFYANSNLSNSLKRKTNPVCQFLK